MRSYEGSPVTQQKGECIAVGRGAVAIWLALKSLHREGAVLVPANICYAAVYPILYAGMQPVFCDVDPQSGELTLPEIRKALCKETGLTEAAEDAAPNLVAAILPHMYGNPIKDLPEMIGLLHARGITVIEDCASLMAKDGAEYVPGTLGDYVIYSTGYSKTIDIGYGGLLYSATHSLAEAEALENALPALPKEADHEWGMFSAIYRMLRNRGENSALARAFYRGLPDVLRPLFLHSIPEERKEAIYSCLTDLDEVIDKRRNRYEDYTRKLQEAKEWLYEFHEGAVPWRLNLRIPNRRREFIELCLKRGLPVSDWYPPVTPVFGVWDDYAGARKHQAEIVNFPLLISDDQQREIITTILEFYRNTVQ